MQDINIETDLVIKELDNIYGLDECKDIIKNYNSYIKLKEKFNFGNYNILIKNKSQYNSSEKLIEVIYKLLKINNIINTNYRYLESIDFQKNKIDENKKEIEEELLIVDLDKIEKSSRYIKEELKKLISKYPNKVFIIVEHIDDWRDSNIEIDGVTWNMEINPVSKENKIDHINKTLNEQKIKIDSSNTFVETLAEEPYCKVKDELLNIIVKCKAMGIKKLNDKTIKEKLKCKYYKEINNKTAIQELDDLVGLEDVKKQIKQIVNYIKVNKQRGKLPMLHMCFLGNPGVGKTEIARIVGRIFAEEHILSDNEVFIEAQRSDLIGKYVGHTAVKTKEVMQKAMGGVLFIDEAYSLIPTSERDFAGECISTLIKEMEDNRDKVCVIFAGYNSEMQEFLNSNTGLDSRIQFKITFNDYTENELYEIFKKMCKKENYKLSSNIKTLIIEYFKQEKTEENFANGRCVRNLFEKIKFEQAERIVTERAEDINLIKIVDVKKAIDKSGKKIKIKKKIGF